MSQNLVIVESPAKAKTIEKFLGKDFRVMSSYGHVRDLPRKGLSVDVENRFEPTYEVSAEKKKVIAELKKAVKQASLVWLASDEDREGEAIAWHLEEVLGLDESNTRRIVFHEITKPAITAAIENYRTIGRNLVDGQQAGWLASNFRRYCGKRSRPGSPPAGCSQWRCAWWSTANVRSRHSRASRVSASRRSSTPATAPC